MKNKIYYFTGTGNSMRAALKIGEKLGSAEVISMRSDPSENPAEDCETVGFIFPVYHWTVPHHAADYIKKLKISPDAYVYCISMPSFINGEACEKLSALLEEKGITLSYGAAVYNVANYAAVYPPLPPAKIVVPAAERRLDKIAEDIAARRTCEIPHANLIIRIRSKGMLKYRDLSKKADYGFKIRTSCISCGLCSRVCPVNNIYMKNGRPRFKHDCAQCMACVSCCPKGAIGYKLTDKDYSRMHINPNDYKIAKIMGIPKGRKPYRNPYITPAQLIREKTEINGKNSTK